MQLVALLANLSLKNLITNLFHLLIVMTMEVWLAELEMEVVQAPSLINSNNQCETMEATFTEQLSALLGEDFPYPCSAESNTSSPDQWDLDNIIIDQFTPPFQIFINNENDNNKNSNNNVDHGEKIDIQETQEIKEDKEEISNKQAVRGGAKRKRQPNQVQDHIIAERRRRELLSQLFISLSALVPGLKKVDKTSVLGEAIKHMKQLQEKVKALEEVVAKRPVESLVVVKKSQLVVNDDNGDDNESSSMVDSTNSASANSGGSCSGSGNGGGTAVDNVIDSLPEIEVRISGETLLLKVYCRNQKRILSKLFEELQKHDLSVTNCSVVPFESLALDITVVAQMQRGLNMNAQDFVRNLRSAFRFSSC